MGDKMYCKPNLPSGRVSLAIISGEYKDILTELANLKIKVIKINQHENLPLQESSHADMQVLHIKENLLVVVNKEEKLEQQLVNNNIKYTLCKTVIEPKYPKNVLLNALRLGEYLFCNEKAVDQRVKEICLQENIQIVNTKQSYTKCSTAVVAENAIITADSSIAKVASLHEIDVLKISEGFIELKGYNYGFIGGCSGKISKDCLAFCGNIKAHPDYENIKSFAKNYGVNLYSLSNRNLLDIGSILPISCYK